MPWLERQPAGDADKNWRGTACSSDGQILYCCNYDGHVYKSMDAGVTWTDISPVTNQYWQDVCCSPDGAHVMAIASGYRRRSHDYGATWPVTNQNASYLQNACCWGSTYSYDTSGGDPNSSQSITRWLNSSDTPSWIGPGGDIRCIACDLTGESVIMAKYGGRVWRSTDHAQNWSETRPCGDVNKNWICVGCSDDFSTQLIGVYGGRLYTSFDGGLNWVEEQPAGAVDLNWRIAEVSADGLVRLAGVYGGRLYKSG